MNAAGRGQRAEGSPWRTFNWGRREGGALLLLAIGRRRFLHEDVRLMRLQGLENQFFDLNRLASFRKVEHFHTHDVVLRIIVEHHARTHLLGIHDLGLVETQIECVSFRINR